MLKWLRKYNTWILVIGGSLLMVAFLVPDAIQQIGQRRLSGPVMRMAGHKVTYGEFERAHLERGALEVLLGREMVARIGGGESIEHWVMLTRLAEEAGYVGGVDDGKESLRRIVTEMVRMLGMDTSQTEQVIEQVDKNVWRAAAEARLSQEDVYRALSKLGGVIRLRNTYLNALRYSDSRLISGVKQIADGASVKYVLVPPERLITDETPEPTDAEIGAHFERFKDTDPTTGDLGIGYKLPERVKVSWIFVNALDVRAAVKPDPIEVQKRMLKTFGSNPPTGNDGAAARTRIESDIRTEIAEKVLKALDQSVRGDLEKMTRRLESDGGFKHLPADWTKPDLRTMAAAAARRASELTGVAVPEPVVEVRNEWQTGQDLFLLSRVGEGVLSRGERRVGFPEIALGVREIAGNNDFGLQVGVPLSEALTDGQGNRFYIMITDARKASPPDTIAEVRDRVVRDIKRLNAFETLQTQSDEYRQRAIADGLDSIAKAPEGVTGPAAEPLSVANARVDSTAVSPAIPGLNIPEFRKAVLSTAAALDPMANLSTVNPAARTVVVPTAKALGLIVAQIEAIEPMTLERYRSLQAGMVQRLQRDELGIADGAADPFSQSSLEKRLNVEYLDGREQTTDGEAKRASGPAT